MKFTDTKKREQAEAVAYVKQAKCRCYVDYITFDLYMESQGTPDPSLSTFMRWVDKCECAECKAERVEHDPSECKVIALFPSKPGKPSK